MIYSVAAGSLVMLHGHAIGYAENEHVTSVRLSHPSAAELLEKDLYQTRDSSGDLLEYWVDVDSVICGDGQCEIITVRLAFDELGNYLRYEFPEGGDLTKRGHKQFSPEDHAQLHELLSSPDSILQDIAAKDVTSPAESQEGAEVDGVSGATLISSRGGIVPGAVYTCYTLWHWVNGDVQGVIRDITANEIGLDQLKKFLAKGTEEQSTFAIERMVARSEHGREIQDMVFISMVDGNTDLIEHGLAYLEGVGAVEYYSAIERLFSTASSDQRTTFLSALTSTELEAPPRFFERMSKHLPKLESYLEVHLFIGLLTYHESISQEIINNVMPLLENDSFIISRKAYHFLMRQELSESERSAVEAYRKKHVDRL